MGWKFLMAASNDYMGAVYGYIAEPTFGGSYISPTAMIAGIVDNAAVQVIIIAAISLMVFGWWGTVFLSSTRVIFAAAFDRILPGRRRRFGRTLPSRN